MDAREHKQATQASFGRAAERYVDSVTHSTGSDLDRVCALSEAGPGLRALDIATGGGHTARVLATAGASVVATDLTPRMLQAARGHFRDTGLSVAVSAGDAEALPFGAATFDRVTCRIAPHHFGDPEAFVREAARVLAPDGLFVLEDHRGQDEPALAAWLDRVERQRDPTHVQAYTESQWCTWCADAGLTVEHTEIYTKVHDFRDWCARLDLSGQATADLEAAFLSGPAGVAEAFQFVLTDGRLRSWANATLLLCARRLPAPR